MKAAFEHAWAGRLASRVAILGSASVLALGLSAPAVAQEAAAPVPGQGPRSAEQAAEPPQQTTGADEAGTEIVVTGIRRGIGDAIAIKRNETSIVEAISAEDIGKLPDVSIGESLARLPGLAAQRVNGRAQVISIRGLAPDFTTTLLNGRQQASSGDNRAVEFDQYPAELLSSVVVYKTPDAQVSGMGLSGTADLRTVRPLEFGEQAIALNVRGEITEGGRLNSDIRNWGTRISASYIDQFANDTIGVAIGYARLDSPSGNRHFKGYGYEAFPGATAPASAAGALLLNGQEAFATSRINTRDAVIGIVEWQPSDAVRSIVDVYYSRFDQNEVTRGAQWFSNPFADGLTFTGVETEDRGGSPVAVRGNAVGAVPIIRNDNNRRDDELISIGLNNRFGMDGRTTFVTDLSYSRNKRRETILETYAGRGRGIGGVTPATPDIGRTLDTIGFETPSDGYPTYAPGLSYDDADQVTLGDRAPWGGWGHDGAIRFPDVEEAVYALDLRVSHDMDGGLGFLGGFDVGVNYTHRSKDKRVDDFDLFLKNGRQQVAVDPNFLVRPTNLDFVGFGPVLSVDIARALDTYYDRAAILDANFYDKNWSIEEDVVTFFAKSRIAAGRLTGNLGVQAVWQTQRSEGVVINGLAPGQPIVPQRIVGGDDYVDILPSINLVYDLGGGHRFRLAASKTMARPRMDEMRANVSPGFNSLVCSGQTCAPGTIVNPWSASGGNPDLQPWRAKAVDAAYEWYIDGATYISIAGFYKWLDSYIYQQAGTFDFSGIPLPPTATAIPPGVVISPIGQITLPANGSGGYVRGLEFSGALNFGSLTGALEGLGVIGSLSLTGSDLNASDNPDPTQEVRIPGLSGTVYNLTGYYERDGFQARISQRYRSGFKGEVVQLFATRGFTEILADRQVDAQIGYTIQNGPLTGLGALLQVNNLTDSPYRTRLGLDGGGTRTDDGGSLLETYERYGRQFLFGFNYRF